MSTMQNFKIKGLSAEQKKRLIWNCGLCSVVLSLKFLVA